jgi:hypothetical protein
MPVNITDSGGKVAMNKERKTSPVVISTIGYCHDIAL